MRKADTTIAYVEPFSPAARAGILAGDTLLSVNGCEVHDILEYRYLTAEYEVEIEIRKINGEVERLVITNDYEDLGLEFREGLIDEAQSCTNKCIFCFIDQLPKGMRETVYFKDDDTRLSFLQGNYVTLTNLSDDEIDRLIKMRVSPINVSVHATDPDLRCKMLHNRFAGKCYDIMKRFAQSGIMMNCQIVLCPEINDGAQLDRTIADLEALFPNVNSVSAVPVGLTRYREGLYPLKPYTKDTAARVIAQVSAHQERLLEKIGTRLIYLSDEFYIKAGLPVPEPEEYEGFPQLENGVGLVASLKEEFDAAVKMLRPKRYERGSVMMATGEIVGDFIGELARQISGITGIDIRVYPIKNNFFGGEVNVSGLVTGGDIIDQLKDKPKAELLLIPQTMLRDGDEVFLDDVTVEQVEEALGMPVAAVANDGYEFVEAITGEELEF